MSLCLRHKSPQITGRIEECIYIYIHIHTYMLGYSVYTYIVHTYVCVYVIYIYIWPLGTPIPAKEYNVKYRHGFNTESEQCARPLLYKAWSSSQTIPHHLCIWACLEMKYPASPIFPFDFCIVFPVSVWKKHILGSPYLRVLYHTQISCGRLVDILPVVSHDIILRFRSLCRSIKNWHFGNFP